MRENAPDKADSPGCIEKYDQPAYDRKVCFVQLDGKRKRFNYSLLVDEEFYPENNMIVLYFTSGIVTLVGIHLDKLFADLELNMPRVITCVDSRYNQLQENELPVVNQITITKN